MTDSPLLVRDYMHDTIFIQKDGATFKDALAKMMQAQRNGVFIVDASHRVVGVVSAWDLIERVVPDYLEADKHLASFESGAVLIDRVKAVADDPVDGLMTKNVYKVHEDSTIMEVATMLSEFKLRMLPVVDANNKLVGCINRTDVKCVFARILNIA